MSPQSTLIFGNRGASAPFITIAIPTYKRFDLLRQAIGSALLQQPFSAYEVVVVDNDQSPDLLGVLADIPSSRIAVYQNPDNLGLWGNMNKALELSRGEWVVFLPDDDQLRPGALAAFEKLLCSCDNRRIGCLVGGVELLGAPSRQPLFEARPSIIHFPVAPDSSPGEKAAVVQIKNEMPFQDIPKLCSSFFRRELFLELGGWDAECFGYADVAVYLRIQSRGQLFACREIFGRFLIHDANLSHPGMLWETFPVQGAHHLLSEYADEASPLGKGVRDAIERTYVEALWKRQLAAETRRSRAAELLRLLVRNPRRRFLLQNIWLLEALGWVYSQARPVLGQVSQAMFRWTHG